jgi:hypothetical protein
MTMHNEYFLKRQIQIALYSLKRHFGGAIVVYHLLNSVADSRTGAPTVTTLATRIPRAIILPVKISRDIIRNISVISANKQMVMGGGYDSGKRLFLIDRRDAPTLQLAKDDWLAYANRKYAIESIEEYEFDAAWAVTAKHLVGETVPSELSQTLASEDTLVLDEDVSEVIP